jgi:hypothetical protein
MSIPPGPPKQPSGDYPPSGYPSGGGQPGGFPSGGGQPGGFPSGGGQPGGYPSGGGQPGGFPPSGYPTPGYPGGTPYQPAPQQGTSGLAIAGLVLAFLAFPIGFILSLIALFTTGKGRKKGRGLAAAGLIISLLITGGVVTIAVVVKHNVKNITTIADPGCIAGKDIILKNGDLGGGSDPTVVKAKLQTLVTGLDAAATSARNDNVRAAMTALSNDYRQLLDAMKGGKNAPADIETKATNDANRIDELCTLGGAQK